MAMKKIIDLYAQFVSRNPILVLILVIVMFAFGVQYMQSVEVKSMDINNILPNDLDVVKSMEILEDSFGGTASGLIIIELDPQYAQSSEPRDVRELDILLYQQKLQTMVQSLEDVISTSSSSSVLTDLNGGVLPRSQITINELTKGNAYFDSYISEDRKMSLIRITLTDDFEESIASEIDDIINQIPKPSGIMVNVGGSSLEDGIVMELMGPDMNKTSMYSMIGILLVLLIITGSIRYGLIPLATIIFGLVWAMGLVGFLGMNLNTATSAVISMIMGIGIDFGIQISTRFREERKNHQIEESMIITMESVLNPMVITTFAALLGFWAMSLGQIRVLGQMGTIMAFGVTMCFLAAITVVPSIIIISERIKRKIFSTKA